MGSGGDFSEGPKPPGATALGGEPVQPRFRRLRAWAALGLAALFFSSTLVLVGTLISLGLTIGSWSMRHLRGTALALGGLLAVALFLAAFVLVVSLWPRRAKFKPPGPELKRDLHPALFKEIDRVAARCDVKGPKHVYLAPDVNAFVADVGGVAGLFTTRVLGVGLPLLHCLSRAEFRSVLAHEFGHFARGDTRVGGWVFRTRTSIQAIVENLSDAAETTASGDAPLLALFFAMLRWPFVAFGGFYLRFSLALSRAQELSADALAAQLEGADVLVRSLQRVRHAALGFDGYMRSEVVPLLEQGVLPPIGPGLSRFLQAPDVVAHLEKVSRVVDAEPEHQLDSHPPLHARVAHARGLRLGPHRGNVTTEGPAFELVTHLSELELLLAEPWVGGSPLKRMPWENVGPPLERGWRERARELAPLLSGVTPASLPHDPAQLRGLLARAMGDRAQHLADEKVTLIAVSLLSQVVTVVLLDAGFMLESTPGVAVQVLRGDERYEPVRLLREYLFEGKDEAWRAMWDSTGLAHVELAPTATDDEAPPA
ncbi:MAG: M48 family metalloprotease [Archangium sp.]|nr:M48 family metalloprotease [Archangium sp.]